jgi:hypothetical protein
MSRTRVYVDSLNSFAEQHSGGAPDGHSVRLTNRLDYREGFLGWLPGARASIRASPTASSHIVRLALRTEAARGNGRQTSSGSVQATRAVRHSNQRFAYRL